MVYGIPFICIIGMCALLVSEQFSGFSYSVCKVLFILHQCPVNLNMPAPKTGALQISPKTQNGSFLENFCNSFDYNLVIYGEHVSK
jgi:hypothetical protein